MSMDSENVHEQVEEEIEEDDAAAVLAELTARMVRRIDAEQALSATKVPADQVRRFCVVLLFSLRFVTCVAVTEAPVQA